MNPEQIMTDITEYLTGKIQFNTEEKKMYIGKEAEKIEIFFFLSEALFRSRRLPRGQTLNET